MPTAQCRGWGRSVNAFFSDTIPLPGGVAAVRRPGWVRSSLDIMVCALYSTAMPDTLIAETQPSAPRIRALALMSGGLDSQLAVCVMREQRIDVHAVVFDSPFFDSGHARRAAEQLDLPLHVIDFASDIVGLLDAPAHGFGTGLNPCIDCHARMLRRAGERLPELGCHFLVTGEVLEQRPKSQNRRSLELVARDSGFADWIVRPLSGQLLPATRPEALGWIRREGLLAIRGRGRRVQLALAERYGLRNVPTPAGGCRLTEPNFCRRLSDLKEHEGLAGVRGLSLLRTGRHFRLADSVKLVVGRDERDNTILEGTAELYELVLKAEDVQGPTGLLPYTADDAQIELAARICVRYSDAPNGRPVAVRVRSPRRTWRLQVSALDRADVEKMMV
jgi:tRNA-uridine 2-sulfurtransferase